MTPKIEVLARRAVACKGWRWMPGMLTDVGERVTDVGAFYLGTLPDLTDPATKGCMLALAREAWKRPTAFLYYYGGSWFFDPQQSDPTDHPSGRTEAEALVAALEAEVWSCKACADQGEVFCPGLYGKGCGDGTGCKICHGWTRISCEACVEPPPKPSKEKK